MFFHGRLPLILVQSLAIGLLVGSAGCGATAGSATSSGSQAGSPSSGSSGSSGSPGTSGSSGTSGTSQPGGSSPSGASQPVSSGSGTTSGSGASAQFLFAALANASGPERGMLAEYSIDPTTGALTAIGSPFMSSVSATELFRDPNRQFLYVEGELPNENTSVPFNVIAQYLVNTTTGAPQEAAGSPFNFNQQELAFMIIRPDLRFAYVSDFADPTILHVISMDPSSGALLQEVETTRIPEAANATPLPSMMFDSSGHFLYFGISETNVIAGYSSDPKTGTLTAVPGSPFRPRTATPGACSPKSLFCGADIATTGSHLYYVSTFFDSVAGFTVDPATGALTELSNSPFVLPPHEAFHAASTPSGDFLYAESPYENVITGYSVDSSSGNLTQIAGSPWSTSSGPQRLVIDRNGQFLYDAGSMLLDGFQINPLTGALTRVPGAPYPLSGTTGLAIVN